MVQAGFVAAASGPLLVKLFLALILLAVFLSLRGRETEGVMSGYAILAGFLVLRDLLYAVLPGEAVYQASDLVFFGLLCSVHARALGSRLGLWLPLAFSLVAAFLLSLKAALGLAPGLPAEVLVVIALVPIFFAFALAGRSRQSADSPGPLLLVRGRYYHLGGALFYLALGALLGRSSFAFQAFVVPLFYALGLVFAFRFVDELHEELVGAVAYYEESIDNLYDLLLASGSAVKAEFSIQEVLDRMAAAMAEKVGADGAAILLADEFDEAVAVRAVSGRFAPPWRLPESLPRSEERVADYVRHARFRLGEGLLGEVAQGGKQLYIPDAAADPRIARNGEEDWLRLSSLIAAPLVVRDRVIGAVALAKSSGEAFGERDFDRAKLLANFGSIAIANSFSFLEAAERGDIDREAAIAEGIQKTILPRKFPEISGIALGASTSPARGVCSDYYDAIQTRPERVLLAAGDVAGKGVAAGIVMAMIRAMLHLVTNSAKDTATLLAWINRGLCGKVETDQFATLALISVDTRSGEAEFANAAHQPLLIYRRDADAIETVDIKSIPIGVERGTTYAAKRLRLRAGDALVLYSDGIVEAMNEQGRQFGRKNLGNAILRYKDLPARDMAEAIRGEVLEFAGRSRQHDDQTVFVMKVKL